MTFFDTKKWSAYEFFGLKPRQRPHINLLVNIWFFRVTTSGGVLTRAWRVERRVEPLIALDAPRLDQRTEARAVYGCTLIEV